MKIAVDLDDVVLDFFGGVCRSLSMEYDVRDLDPGTLMHSWSEDHPIKKLAVFGEGRTWWDWLQERPHIWATFMPVPGALGGIDRLRRDGHDVECLTTKPEWAERSTWKWLGRWGPRFTRVTIVPFGSPKVEHSDADLLVDDSPKNVTQWFQASRPAILFDRYGNGPDVPCSRAATWPDVVDVIGRLNGSEG